MTEELKTSKSKRHVLAITRPGTGKYWLFGSLLFTIPGSIITGLFIELLPPLQALIWIVAAVWIMVGLVHFFNKPSKKVLGWMDVIFGAAMIALDIVLIVELSKQWALGNILMPFFMFLGGLMVYLFIGVYLGYKLGKRAQPEQATSQKTLRKTAIVSGLVYAILVGVAFGGVVGLIDLRIAQLNAQNAAFITSNQVQHDAVNMLVANHYNITQHDKAVDGFTWHYAEAGNHSGTTILFLHGLPECWYSWRYVMPLVNQSFRLIALDMKGYGLTDSNISDIAANATNFDWKANCQQIFDLMSSLGISKFYVVGHDWGSIIGSMLVTMFPTHVLGFVRMEAPILLSNVDLTNSPQFTLFRSARLGALFMQDAQWFINNVYTVRMIKPFNATDQMYLTYEFARPGVADRVVQYFSNHNLAYMPDLFTKLCNTTWPFSILLLQADHDPAQPESYFNGLSTACSHVQVEWITNASHFTNFDQPGQVAAGINAFLN